LTITLTDPRLIDGWVEAANRNGTTPEAIAGGFLENQGRSYADLFGVGVITGAAFVARFTPAEYGTILAAAEVVAVPEPIPGVPTAEEQQAYDDMVAAYALLENPTLDDTNMYESVVASYAAATAPTNQADIDAAQAANAVAEPVKALLDQLFASPNVVLDDPRLQPGLDLLVQVGLLDAGRPAEILSYVRPEVG
ncbi:MAG: hypothetical protein ACO24H_02435, partial [Polynucleobacter sp.]